MEKAILRTLAYADIFNFPLTKSEIWNGLIYRNSPRILSSKLFNETLDNLVIRKLISQKGNYYFLPGKMVTVDIRNERKIWSKSKFTRAKKIAGVLSLIPWVKFIGVSGSLARENATTDDDIDLFFIVSDNRLWLSRGIIVIILLFIGVYRRSSKIRDMICPNMFISDMNLVLGPKNLYIASEIYAIKPLINKDMVYEKLIINNSWVKKFLPNLKTTGLMIGDKEIRHESRIFNLLDNLAMKLQLLYMRKRLTKEVVIKNLIKFHPEDIADKILAEYRQKTGEID